MNAAVQRAHARDFIEALPDGYNTVIGDQGVKLSGGQRQRLGLARALLTNPTLLILDEAMSALDAESERELLNTLEELRKQMGILIIAHRLAAVRTADTIYVVLRRRKNRGNRFLVRADAAQNPFIFPRRSDFFFFFFNRAPTLTRNRR